MTREDIIAELTPIVRRVFNVSDLELTDDMSAANVEQWTSLSFMTLLTEIEQHYGFKFKMMELLQLKTMGAIISSVQSHCA